MIAKGQRQTDGSYIYTCGNCDGVGFFSDKACPHCYNLNYDELLIQFKTARGERYYAILKAILSIKGKAIVDRAEEYKSKHSNGKMSVADCFHLLMDFKFPLNRFKPLVEWLEETRTIKTGSFRRIQQGGHKVKKTLIRLGYDV